MRVHELAKRLNLSNKDLLDHLSDMKIEGKTHSSSLEPEQIAQIESYVKGKQKSAGGKSTKQAASPAPGKTGASRPGAGGGAHRHPARTSPRSPAGRPASAGHGNRPRSATSSPTSRPGAASAPTDRQSRVERMFIQRKLARRQKAAPTQPEPEPDLDITIQVIEEKEKPKPKPPKPPREQEPPKVIAQPEPPTPPPAEAEQRIEDQSAVQVVLPDQILTPEEIAEAAKKKARKGKEKEPEVKRVDKTPRKKGHWEKGRKKDQTREVITESLDILKAIKEPEAGKAAPTPTVPRPGARRRPQPAGRRPAASGKGRGRKAIRREQRERLKQKEQEEKERLQLESRIVTINEATTVADLAEGMRLSINELIAKLMSMGVIAGKNQRLDHDTIRIICEEFGFEVRESSLLDDPTLMGDDEEDQPEDLQPRPPVVTIMGHVDHGKTKLLDAVRHSDIVAGEAGGITQHIGAYDVTLPDERRVVFLDTPGHEAFTAMRARGAMVTDIVVLVVAADDGVMPQTVEAIHHAKAAEVPIVVAINKVDLPSADVQRVKTELSQHNLLAEDWGGKTPMVEISALKRTGIQELMDILLLEAEILELKANPHRRPRGTIIEAKLDRGRGAVATVLVQSGTLHIGDHFVTGIYSGKVRALVNDLGDYVEEAGPSTPVEVLGIDGVPVAGDPFLVVPDERGARQISLKLQQIQRERELKKIKHVSLEDLHAQIAEGAIKELNLIVRADVTGSVGALCDALDKLPSDKVKTNVIHSGVGTISESDVMLASASNALIIGFNVRPTPEIVDKAKQENVSIRTYRIIYEVVTDIRAALEGLLESKYEESILGRCEVREVFRADRQGVIAGCYVTSGKLLRNANMRILRDDVVIHEGKLESLRRFKEDVKEVLTGFECGLSITRFNDIKAGDMIECFELQEVKVTL